MNEVQSSNATATSVAASEDESRASTESASSSTVVGLTVLEHSLIRALSPIPEVSAVYAETDRDAGLLMVFVVVPEHDDSVYERIVDAEQSLPANLGEKYELRVRAHQGRNPSHAVPLRSLPLFLR